MKDIVIYLKERKLFVAIFVYLLFLGFLVIYGLYTVQDKTQDISSVNKKEIPVEKVGLSAPEINVELPTFDTYEVPSFVDMRVSEVDGLLMDEKIDWEYRNEDEELVEVGAEDTVIAQSVNEGQRLLDGELIVFTVKEKESIPMNLEDIDWESRYYSYSANGIDGNPNVCDAQNNVAWPYSDCNGLSRIGKWNKMICSSYGASRFWERNYPNEAYPLPRTWILDLANKSKVSSGPFKIARDINQAVDGSLISLNIPGGAHIAVLEHVGEDGIIITEANLRSQKNDYGWRRWEGNDIQEWVNYFGEGSSINGYLLPITG